ncbi:DUF998 domain-containing protein [Devosia psychrophila]|jgi:hypothetical protein|uniref:DUF998 domain-containing protein n=1 Tax=Devosia psychrophila TaxID=728005 RepID=A0A0F5Q293_9HYPH|nr:DUF998 domain-containing protein [Devosia psychrophila]KKC34746.1 hypothetical protein WH91_00460 [Devosia psychrophila]SFC06633.1 Protein of unknown function [Devosia psychrophila]
MTSQIRLGAIFWLLTVEFFIAQAVAQAAFPGYSLAHMDISLLGVSSCSGVDPNAFAPVCSPLSLVFNAGMAINGALVVLGVWFTRKLWPQGPLTTAALWILAVGGGDGSILVGLFPLDISLPMHIVGAILALFVAGFGMLAMSAALWRRYRGFAVYTLATGAITLVAFVLYALEIYLGLGRGTMERIAAWPHTLWYIVAGGLILRGYFTRAV